MSTKADAKILKLLQECDEESVQLPDESNTTLALLRRLLVDKCPHVASSIDRITFALNLEYSADDVALTDGDEVALIPPISGG